MSKQIIAVPGSPYSVIVIEYEQTFNRLSNTCTSPKNEEEHYKALGETDDIIHVGCLAHARRKFLEVLKAGSKNKKGTASTVVHLLGKLYHLESQAKKGNFSPEAVMAMGEEKVKPILDKIKALLEESVDAVPPKSLLGKAVAYSLGQWSRIEDYLQDPRLTPDNNIAENAIRPFAVGRKN